MVAVYPISIFLFSIGIAIAILLTIVSLIKGYVLSPHA